MSFRILINARLRMIHISAFKDAKFYILETFSLNELKWTCYIQSHINKTSHFLLLLVQKINVNQTRECLGKWVFPPDDSDCALLSPSAGRLSVLQRGLLHEHYIKLFIFKPYCTFFVAKSQCYFARPSVCICVFLDFISPSSVPLEWPPKLPCGSRYHTTASSRTEGFYVISKRDKLRYLRHTHTASGEPTADTQVGIVSESKVVLLLKSI